jgi:hypothetical protein
MSSRVPSIPTGARDGHGGAEWETRGVVETPESMTSSRWNASEQVWETRLRGRAVLADPRINKGTAFSAQEREALGVVGMLPPRVVTLT